MSLMDEQLLIAESGDGSERSMHIALYIDDDVLQRLRGHDPFQRLEARNLADFCTALEGVSHFHYVVWCCALHRPVSLLELELQAEVDKYAGALQLLTSQRGGHFPPTLHRDLFERVSFAPHLAAESLDRYRVANRHAARFCRDLELRFLKSRRVRVEAWLAAVRRFYRLGHAGKIRQVGYA
jgi:hypothetical protein